MNSNQTLGLVDLLVSLFDPIIQSIDDEAQASQLLKDLGYLPPSEIKFIRDLSDPLKLLGTIIQNNEAEIEAAGDQDQFKIYLEILNGTAGIVHAVNNIGPSIIDNFSNDFISQTGVVNKFPSELFDYLVICMLEKRFPTLHAVLLTVGIIDETYVAETPTIFNTPFLQRKFHWNKIGATITSTVDQLKTAYSWDTGDIEFYKLIKNLHRLGNTLNLDTEITNPFPDTLSAVNQGQDVVTESNSHNLDVLKFPLLPFDSNIISLQLYPVLDPVTKEKVEGLGFGLFFNAAEGLEYEIAPRINLKINYPEPQLDAGIVFKKDKGPELVYNLFGSGSLSSDLSLFVPEFSYSNRDNEKVLVFETSIGARLDFVSWSAKLGVKNDRHFFTEISIKGASLLIKTDGEDGFLNKVLPALDTKVDFDLTVGFSTGTGLYFLGSSSLELLIPAHVEIGPVSIEAVTVRIQSAADKVPVTLGANFKASLGPIVATINNVGVLATLSFESNNNGNLGPVQLDLGFKPPDGVGLSVDAGGISGGGFLKYDDINKEYIGALQLEFQDLFSLQAFGIISTKMPDGSSGFSLLIVVTAEFTPVQLGFGFTLNGVGGLLGLNRTTNVDVLKQGIKTNSIESILFPQNVVANITRIISDIKQVFPSQQGHFLICPMGKIGWGTPTLITLELGILIEIPSSGFKILGVLKALLPEEDDALLRLQVNFLGEIDFDNKSISFIASLYDSRLLTFTLTGDMAFRILFGDNPLFLLSVGGFHPSFTQVPADLKDMKRLTISLYDGDNASITLQSYFAVTSNTVQFGAKAELLAGSRTGFNIYGFVNYDVLFQFNPFHFDADLSGGVSLRHNTSTVMGIHVSAELSGPGPWDAHGEASVSFFFFSISVPFHVTWGSADNEPPAEKADLLIMLTDQVNDDSNWKAGVPSNSKIHVTIKKLSGDTLAVHPFGVLAFSQRLLPLGIQIARFGNELPQDVNLFDIKPADSTLSTDPVNEEFAPANFFDLSDAEKLSRPSFEPMKSGFEITGSNALNIPNDNMIRDVEYELSYLGKENKTPPCFQYPASFFKAHTKLSATSQSSISFLNNRISVNAPQEVSIDKEQYTLANVSDMKPFGSSSAAGTYTEVLQQYNNLVNTNPHLKDQVQILSSYEVNLN